MKQKTEIIKFTDGVTTKEALVGIAKNMAIVFGNTWRAVNVAAHKQPWVFIVLVVAVATFISVVCVGQARVERDQYSKECIRLNIELDSCKALYNDVQQQR